VGVDRDADGIHLGTVVSFDIVNTGVATATIEAVAIKVDAGQGCIPKIDDIIGSLSKINPYRMIPQGGSETLRAGIVSTMAEFIAAGADVFLIGAIRYRDPTLGSFVRGFCFWQVGRGWISVGGEQYHFDVPWEQFCMATAESHADT
jgi:hypothetical protein